MRLRSPSGSLSRVALALLGVALLPASLLGEDVYLKNGRVFRGVIARVADGVVEIEMPGGTLGFPMSAVRRIEASDAVYREYQSRRDTLDRRHAAAAEWLELARWAKIKGLEPAAREAGLAAGRMDPEAVGVRAFLGELGFVYEESSGSYLALEESMARRGLIYDGGAWVPTAEREARREHAQDEATARSAAAERAAEAESAAEDARRAAEDRAAAEPATVGIPLWMGGGGVYVGPYFAAAAVPQLPRSHDAHRRPPATCPPVSVAPPAPPPVAASARQTSARRQAPS